MANKIRKMWNGALFVGAQGFQGLVKSITMPTVASTTSAHETVSTLGSINLANGKEAMESTMEWQGADASISAIAYNTIDIQDLQFRSQIEQHDGTQMVLVPIAWFFRGRFREKTGANFEAKTDATSSSTMDVYYIREEIGGRAVYEYDPMNSIEKINGVDKLAQTRANLGL